jgi:hypothetical protein
MAEFKATLKSNGDKASPFLRPFSIGKTSGKHTYADFTTGSV